MADRIEQLRRLLESDPNDAFCLYALGMEYVTQNQPGMAASHLELSLRSDADQPYAHFHLARYWAEELANQDSDKELKEFFTKLSAQLEENKDKILEEMTVVQGNPADIGGYYHPPMEKVCEIMQPSATLNQILEDARSSVK